MPAFCDKDRKTGIDRLTVRVELDANRVKKVIEETREHGLKLADEAYDRGFDAGIKLAIEYAEAWIRLGMRAPDDETDVLCNHTKEACIAKIKTITPETLRRLEEITHGKAA